MKSIFKIKKITCPKCHNPINITENICPICGQEIDETYKNKQKKNAKGCMVVIIGIILIGLVYSLFRLDNSLKHQQEVFSELEKVDSIQNVKDSIQSIKVAEINAKIQDSLLLLEQQKEKEFLNSKAGKIWKKHPEWSKEDCIRLANKKIWIGMHYDMLLYLRGKPNHVNTSNYGNGNQYQCCWDDYDPSCFYMGQDEIITSYN